jgi:hypothetical protein
VHYHRNHTGQFGGTLAAGQPSLLLTSVQVADNVTPHVTVYDLDG